MHGERPATSLDRGRRLRALLASDPFPERPLPPTGLLLALSLLAPAPGVRPADPLDCTAGSYQLRVWVGARGRVVEVMLYEQGRPFMYLGRETEGSRADLAGHRLDLVVKPRAPSAPELRASARGRDGSLHIRGKRHPMRCHWRR